MTDFLPAGTTVTGAISLLQRQPMEPEVWLRLANVLKSQSDTLSSDSLDMIVEGLWEFKLMSDSAVEKGDPPPELSPATSSLFLKLSTSYNDPKILKRIGEVYLKEWGLAAVAHKHFERALFLGGSEKELKPLLEASAPGAPPVAPPRREEENAEAGKTKELLEKAEQSLAKGELTQATKFLKQANWNPLSPEKMAYAWDQLGLAYFQIHAYAQMEEAYLSAVLYDPKALPYVFNLGLAQQSLGKLDLAEASYLKADKLQPGDAKVWCNLGSLYFQAKRHKEAEAGLKKAIKANPKYARAWDNLAAVLGAQNKLDEALVAVETALKLQPGYPEAYFKLGTILFAKNSLPAAKQAFQRSLGAASLIEPAKAYLKMIDARLTK